MSKLTSLIHLMDAPEYDGCTQFLVSNNYVIVGTNSSNKLFYLTFAEEGWSNRIFIPHEQAHRIIHEVNQCRD